MCARIAQLVLAGLFVFIVATVAAFRYLEWWQALLASAGTFVGLLFAARVMIGVFIGRLGSMAKGLFDVKSRVLRGATVQVHSVKPIDPPADLPEPDEDGEEDEYPLRERAWYQVEATIFPDAKSAGPMTHWDLDDLRVVPAGTPPISLGSDADGEDFELFQATPIVDGTPFSPDEAKFQGPQRLRFAVGVPREVRELEFRYYFEQFGRVTLPRPALS